MWHCGCHQRAGRQEGGSEREQAIGDVCHVGWMGKEGSWGRTDRYGEIRQCGVPDGVKEQVMVMLREFQTEKLRSESEILCPIYPGVSSTYRSARHLVGVQ